MTTSAARRGKNPMTEAKAVTPELEREQAILYGSLAGLTIGSPKKLQLQETPQHCLAQIYLCLLAKCSAVAHSDATSTRQSEGIFSNVCDDNPNLQPIIHAPARRAVSTSTSESPIISVSSGATPASTISAFSPSGSGFFVAKLLPP